MTMKHLKFYLTALLAVLAFPQLSQAQNLSNGTVKCVLVVGKVDLINIKDGTTTALTRGQSFQQGYSVHANKGANALLVMSNGATLKVKEDTTLDVTSFQQAKFDEATEGTYLRLNKDPSQSVTDLKLSDGSLQGEVKKLNTDANSKFTINTPAGSAGIRGTIIDITIVRNAAGQITGIIANCVVGNVSFTPGVTTTTVTSTGTTTAVTNANIGTGSAIQVNLTVDPNTGLITGGGLVGSNLSTQSAQDFANALTETVNAARALDTSGDLAAQPAPTIEPNSSGGVSIQTGTGSPITITPTESATNPTSTSPASTGPATTNPVVPTTT
jgi:hypothetical protein